MNTLITKINLSLNLLNPKQHINLSDTHYNLTLLLKIYAKNILLKFQEWRTYSDLRKSGLMLLLYSLHTKPICHPALNRERLRQDLTTAIQRSAQLPSAKLNTTSLRFERDWRPWETINTTCKLPTGHKVSAEHSLDGDLQRDVFNVGELVQILVYNTYRMLSQFSKESFYQQSGQMYDRVY